MAAEPLPIIDLERPRLGLAPEYPPGVPVPDPPIIVIGHDLHETWDKVWDFVKEKAHPFVQQMEGQTLHLLAEAVPAIEAYTANGLKALGGFVNDVGDYAHIGNWVIGNQMGQIVEWAGNALDGLTGGLYGALTHINNLEGLLLPQILDDIARLRQQIQDVGANLIPQIEAWAVGNIFDPLVDRIGQTEARVRGDVWQLVGGVASNLQGQIDANALNTLEHLAPIAAAVAALEQFKDECAQPMCETMGPKTDLGKFLKGLQLAGILALLMEVGNMTEADVEARLRDIAGDVSNIVSTFDHVFVGGGGSLLDFGKALL